jgi:hypothetical protein
LNKRESTNLIRRIKGVDFCNKEKVH